MIRGETDVVLKCGCITTDYGSIKVLGDHQEIQVCEAHDGWFKILREASDYERFAFFVLKQAIPARKATRTLGDLLRLSSGYSGEENPERIRYQQQSLY